MSKNAKRLLCVLLCLTLGVVGLVAGCRSQEAEPTTEPAAAAEKVPHTVTVKNTSGEAMEGVGVYVYTDQTMAELVWFAKTDDQGRISFTEVLSDSYVAVLSNLPQGYVAQEQYALTGTETELFLEKGLVSQEALPENTVIGLGDVMFDFTITDTDGNTYTLSQLLQEKNAVVLNFWYLECAPCREEFPYLQQAYEAYSESIALLGLNPVNTDVAAIARFKEDMGLTFPLAAVDYSWEQLMGLVGYPTTVVIDRYGTVTLIHSGSIPDAQTFQGIFETFAQEDYEGQVVENVEDIVMPEPTVGTPENPLEIGGVSTFELTVAPGQEVCVHLYKAFDLYMSIENSNAYVISEGKTYKPSNGKVGLMVNCEDSYTPVVLLFGNTGDETQTYTVKLGAKAGTIGNPYSMSLGDFTVKVAAGNDQGVYYSYKAKEDGRLTLQCLSSTAGVEYDFVLYNLDSFEFRTLAYDGSDNTLSVMAKKGQTVQFIMSTVPDESFSYPAGTFQMQASFDNGVAVEEEEELQKNIYTVTVTDEEGNPLSGVTMKLEGAEYTAVVSTDAQGVVSAELAAGTYTVTLTLPLNYTAENTVLTLDENNLTGSFVLTEVVEICCDYKVTVLKPDGTPAEGVRVILGSNMLVTDAAGIATVNLPEGEYKVYLSGLPEGLSTEDSNYTFPEDSTGLTVTLIYTPGTELNPIVIDTNPYTTQKISGGSYCYYQVYKMGGMELTLAGANGYVIYNGTTYGPDAAGEILLPLESAAPTVPVSLIVGNAGSAKTAYTLTFTDPLGSYNNPEVLTSLDPFTTVLPEADEDGYYYQWTAQAAGKVTLWIESVDAGLAGDIRVNDMWWLSADGTDDGSGGTLLELDVASGDVLKLQVLMLMDEETWTVPGGTVVAAGSFTAETEDPSEETTEATEETTEATEETTEATEEATEATEETTEATEETTEATEEATEATEPEDTEITYTITVTDYPVDTDPGTPHANVLMAVYDAEGGLAGTCTTDSSGVAELELLPGNYTVELLGVDAYYEKSTAVLTYASRNLTICLAGEPTEDVIEYVSACDENSELGGNFAYGVAAGGTHVCLGSGQLGYSTEYNVTLFAFAPTEAGVYAITTSNAKAEIGYWNVPNYTVDMTAYQNVVENAYTITVQAGNVGNTYVVGIVSTGGIEECALVITRLGDPGYNPDYEPYVTYSGTGEVAAFSLADSVTLTDVDYKGSTADYTLVFNEADGYYHLNSADGPTVYADLVNDRMISIDKMLNGEGNIGGTAFRAQFYDANGNLVKEDYTERLQEYVANADPSQGVYPLTEELLYILKNGIVFIGWADPQDPNYLFADVSGINTELAWMFLFCYG